MKAVLIRDQPWGIDVNQVLGEGVDDAVRYTTEEDIAVRGEIAAHDIFSAIRIFQRQLQASMINPNAPLSQVTRLARFRQA